MKTKTGDLFWGCILLIWISIMVIPSTRMAFIDATKIHPYFAGFIKFFILATMGDWLGVRIIYGDWSIPKGFVFKAIVWGILGIMITLVFTIFAGGTEIAQSSNLLPFHGSKIAHAFFSSTVLNLTFGPMLYIYHKFGDLMIDFHIERDGSKITLKSFVDKIDWYSMVSFSWIKSCTLIWIPCHTIVFLLPAEYRVLTSAFLSILLGVLVAISKRQRTSGLQSANV